MGNFSGTNIETYFRELQERLTLGNVHLSPRRKYPKQVIWMDGKMFKSIKGQLKKFKK